MLTKAYIGQATTAYTHFNILNPSPASYTVYDFNNNLVLTGLGVQDMVDPTKWSAIFTIPANAPICDVGQKYTIKWLIKNDKETLSSAEYFIVTIENDPLAIETMKLHLQGSVLNASLEVEEQPTTINYRVIDENGLEYVKGTLDPSIFTIRNGNLVYTFTVTDTTNIVPHLGVCPLFIEWAYDSNYEIHPMYIISPKMYMFIDGVRKIVDRARNQDINPNLVWNDVDIAHYVLDGLQRVNGSKPSLTQWSITTVPVNMYEFVKKAASIAALRAQYLAEGMAAFDFQGMAVQLSIDRTQYIQTMADVLESELEQRLPSAKRLLIRQSGPGNLGISINATTNFAVIPGLRHIAIPFIYRGMI